MERLRKKRGSDSGRKSSGGSLQHLRDLYGKVGSNPGKGGGGKGKGFGRKAGNKGLWQIVLGWGKQTL